MTNAFFKRYMKVFMAVFGSVLMITFVISSRGGGGGFGGSSNTATLGTLNGVKITTADPLYIRAQNAIAITDRFKPYIEEATDDQGNPLQDAHQQALRFAQPIDQFLDPQHQPLSLMLVLYEAQQYGLTVSEDDITNQIRVANMHEDKFQKLLDSMNLSQAMFRKAIGDNLTIIRVVNFALQGVQPSVPELAHFAVDLSSTASVHFVALTTSETGIGADPSEAELAPQFEAYKNQLPAGGQIEPPLINGHTYPFGYKYPDQIQLEYVEIPRDEVRKTLTLTPDDQIDALRQYQANPSLYMKTPTAPSIVGPSASQPATQSASQPSPVLQPFDAVRTDILNDILNKRAEVRMNEIVDAIRVALAKPSAGATQPAAPDYAALVNPIQRQYGVQLKVTVMPAPVDIRQLYENPLGRSQITINANPVPVYYYAFKIKEFATSPQSQILFTTNRESPIASDLLGNKFIFRITQAIPTHSPASLAEVRPQVIRDLKRLREYQANLVLGRQIAQQACNAGLEAAAAEHKVRVQSADDIRRTIFDGRALTPGTVNPEIGPLKPFMDATFDLAAASVPPAQVFPPTAQTIADVTAPPTTQPATAPSATLPAVTPLPPNAFYGKFYTIAAPADQRLTIFCIQLDSFTPAPRDHLANLSFMSQFIRQESAGDFIFDWFNLDKMAARLKFVPTEPFSKS